MRYTALRRPRKPLAWTRTFLCRARAVTPRLTLGMVVSLRVGQHGFDRIQVRAVDCSRTTQLPFAFGRFLGEDVALERHRALDAAASSDVEALLRAALRLHLGHDAFTAFLYLLPTAVLSGGEAL